MSIPKDRLQQEADHIKTKIEGALGGLGLMVEEFHWVNTESKDTDRMVFHLVCKRLKWD